MSNGGQLQLTLDNSGATFFIPAGAHISGTIVGGTIEGDLDLSYFGANMQLEGDVKMLGTGGSGPGTINLTGPGNGLELSGPASLENATIAIGSTNSQAFSVIGLGNATLGSTVTVNQTLAGSYARVAGQGVNEGAIHASASGGLFEIGNAGITGTPFINAGTISVSNGDTLQVVSGYQPVTFINEGTISIDGQSTVEFGAGSSTAAVGTITAAPGATIRFDQGLVNTGATLKLLSGVVLEGGIIGGTIEGTINLNAASQQFTLENNISMSGVNGSGPGTINVTGNEAELFLSGTMTLSNATINLGAMSTQGAVVVDSGGGIVTFASTVTINQTGTGTAGFIGNDANLFPEDNSGTIINEGIINAGVKGSALGFDPGTLTNEGLVEATNGGTMLVGSNNFTNLSGSTLTGGSYEAGAGSTFEFVAFTTVATDNATIILSGAASVMTQLNPNTNIKTTIESSLHATEQGGVLEILAGRNWTQSAAFSNAGTIQMGGGSFGVSNLTNSGTLVGFGTIASPVTNAGAVIAQGGTLSFQGGSLSGFSGNTFTSGTIGADSGATLKVPDSSSITSIDGTIILNGNSAVIQTQNGSSITSSLTTIGSAGALEILGIGNYSSSNSLSNAGTIQLGGGTFSTGKLVDSAGSTLKGFGIVASVFSDSGAVVAAGGALTFTGIGDTFSKPLGGTEIDFGGGTDLLQAGSSLSATTIAIYGNAAVTLAESQNLAGALNLGQGSVNVGANTLMLSGTGSVLFGAVSGTGTLSLAGGSQMLNSGLALSVSNLAVSGADIVTLNTNLTFGGMFTEAAGTKFTVTSGDTFTLSGSSTIAGAVDGSGAVVLSGGAAGLGAGADLAAASLALTNGVVVTVSGATLIIGPLTESAGTSIAILSADTLSLNGAGSNFTGTISGSGTLALAGGTQALQSGAAFTVSNLTIASGDMLTLNESLSYGGALTEASGATLNVASGNTLTLTGSDSLSGAVIGTGSLVLAAGSQSFNTGTMLGIASWTVSGGGAVTVNENLTYAGKVLEGPGGALSVSSGDTLTLTGGARLAGSINGAGALVLSGGVDSFGAGSVLSVSNLSLIGNAKATLLSNLSYTGSVSEANGAEILLGNKTLSLSGGYTLLAGIVAGKGTLALTGGSQMLSAGAALTMSNWTMSGAAGVTLNESLNYGGKFTEGTGAAVAVAGGDTLTLDGADKLSGAVTGAGSLGFSGGAQTLGEGFAVSTSGWSLSAGDSTGVNETLTFSGNYSQSSGTNVTVATGDIFSLTGAAKIQGTFAGGGTLALANATLTGLTVLGGSLTLDDTGIVGQMGGLKLGSSLSAAATIMIGPSGVYQIAGDFGLALGGAATSVIKDNGLLIKSAGAGTGVVAVAVVDNGTIEAASGTFEFTNAITGSGSLKIGPGSVMELGMSAASSLSTIFNGMHATLALASPANFLAPISGFAATDAIDLLKIKATAVTLNASDQLVVTNGAATIATLQLSGNYTGYTFGVTSDGHGGTNIAVTSPVATNAGSGIGPSSIGPTSVGHASGTDPKGGTLPESFDFGSVSSGHFSQHGHDVPSFETSFESHHLGGPVGAGVFDCHGLPQCEHPSVPMAEISSFDWHFV